MCKKHLIWWYMNHHFGCKGTTKNAHTQVKRAFFLKNNRFYLLKQLLCYSLEAGLHKSMQRGRFIRRSRIFQNRRVPLEYGLQNIATGELLSNSLSSCENYCSARQCPKVLHLFHIRKRLGKKTTVSLQYCNRTC